MTKRTAAAPHSATTRGSMAEGRWADSYFTVPRKREPLITDTSSARPAQAEAGRTAGLSAADGAGRGTATQRNATPRAALRSNPGAEASLPAHLQRLHSGRLSLRSTGSSHSPAQPSRSSPSSPADGPAALALSRSMPARREVVPPFPARGRRRAERNANGSQPIGARGRRRPASRSSIGMRRGAAGRGRCWYSVFPEAAAVRLWVSSRLSPPPYTSSLTGSSALRAGMGNRSLLPVTVTLEVESLSIYC